MSKRTFRGILAALLVGAGLLLAVTSFVPRAQVLAAAQVTEEDAWTRGLTPTGQNAWRNFAQHSPETALQAGAGNFVDVFPVYNFGRNPDVDTAAVTEDIWTVGGDFIFPSVAEPISLVSDSAEDNPAGTGAHTVIINGLDANYEYITETVTLNGLTPVLTAISYLRVNRAAIDIAGTALSNVGLLQASQQTSGLILFDIPATKGQATNVAYTVPDGYFLLVTRIYGSVGRNQATSATLEFVIRPFGKAARTVGYAGLNSQGTTWSSQLYAIPAEIPSRTDIKMRVSVSANNSDVNAGFEGYLVAIQ